MSRELRILMAEDDPSDAALLERELRRADIAFVAERAWTREAYLRALEEFKPDLVISDYSMPDFDGITALALLRADTAEIPFILVSGHIGEERAAQALRSGATDYVSKDRLHGVGHAVKRAMHEVEERAQMRRLERMLAQSQKMESVGQLAGGMAHDFNNLLTVILGNVEMLRERLSGDTKAREHAEIVQKAAERGADLVRRLLMFSRQRPLEDAVCDVGAAVASMEPLLRHTLGEAIKVSTEVAPGRWRARIDGAQLENALMNLAVNARDAMPKGGTLAIRLGEHVFDGANAAAHHGVWAGRYLHLSVGDTGSGIPRQVLDRVFEPFFTTKERGKGTGLGLSMVYGLVKQAGGHVAIDSEPGRGTIVNLYLPPTAEDVPAPPPPSAAREAPAPALDGAKVVLVDDNESVRKVAAVMLAKLGCTVLEAADAEGALALLERERGADLLFSDIVMPGAMNGIELAATARQRWPQIRLVLSSGYADPEAVQAHSPPPGTLFVNKPYRRADLLEKLSRALAR